MPRHNTEFQTIRSEGGLLPPDLLRRVVDPAGKLSGVEPTAYGLPAGERINEAITQSWNRLRRHWTEFRAAAKGLPEGDATTGLTNDKWSLPLLRELGFGFLSTSAGPTIEGKTYAISRFAGNTAIHLVGCGVSLDRRAAGVRGAAQSNPHGLVQEFLNRSAAHLWAIVSNGLHFRVLRDNQALSRQSFLEFDLEAMFDGEVYSDFVLLWLIAHATRFLPRNDGRPDSCWLETWSKEAAEQGVAALTDLRGGVEKALEIFGQGFVSHPKNTALREALRKGDVKLSDFHGQLLRIVYRLIFLFVAEDRELEGIPLLHQQDKSDKARLARERYTTHYSTSRLRELASRIKGSRHGDLWRQFQLLVGALSGDDRFTAMREALALPPLGSMLWNPASTTLLNGPGLGDPGTELSNVDFLEALRHLAYIRKDKILRPVDYKNLGSEEFGGVYESFLALTPQISSDGARFTFAEFAGNERKTSGSYYTPDSLVQCLLDSALDPVVKERLAGKTGKEAEKALLAIKVCDKAVGSGHFLVGAAHRLARHLARVRALAAGESEPSPLLYQTALRDVIGHCLYGVDINPMAVELCKVTLWLEALEPGKPLSFLDHHIRCGNSLLGATPELISAGLPDDTFDAIEGDDKEACSSLKKLNRAQREGLRHLFIAEDTAIRERMHQAAAAIDEMSDSKPEDIRRKEAAFRNTQQNYDFQKAWDLANLWCAAFVIKKQFAGGASDPASLEPSTLTAQSSTFQAVMFGGTEEATKAKAKKTKASRRASSEIPVGITTQHLRDFVEGGAMPDGLLAEAKRLAEQFQFFHFHLAFPEVFAQGGFDVSLGNPPWERTAFEDFEFFAVRAPELLTADTTALRKNRIAALELSDPHLFAEFVDARRAAHGENHFFINSGKYPLGASGRINTYALFADLALASVNRFGRIGLIVQSSLATDAPMEDFWRYLVTSRRLVSLVDFENKNRIFSEVHPEQKFCLLTVAGESRPVDSVISIGFWLTSIEQIHDPERIFQLTPDRLATINPNTNQPPVCRTKRDFDLVYYIHKCSDVMRRQGETKGIASAWRALMTAASSGDFKTIEQLSTGVRHDDGTIELDGQVYVPLLEAKLIHQYDHSYATFDGTSQECRQSGSPREVEPVERTVDSRTTPRYWAVKRVVDKMFDDKSWNKGWILGVRDVTNVNNERTTIAAALTRVGLIQPLNAISCATPDDAAFVLGALNSMALDYVARQKVSGRHLNITTFSQLPIPKPT